ncbi:methyl esterase 11 [Actinidia rufa]|uniref:Methyl esterase 11 n=1 Tax=Actinidia rufa TaxID=165716 RepID=A0A7J0EKE6_9ERIC|nr:methyl esterase 11 [Actinidia rufa]
MGLCFSQKAVKPPPAKRIRHQSGVTGGGSSDRWTRSSKKEKLEESMMHERTLAAAILYQQHKQQQLQNGGGDGGVLPFDRSSSLRYPTVNAKKQPALPRSSSSRARSLTDPLLQPHQLVNQEVKLDDLETNQFVLVHGGGFGAWCWYKTIALLEEGGFRVTAIDLTGSGIHSLDTNSITSLSQYVILVGHDFGGTCISYAMELFPHRVSKAVFIAAAMLTSGQSTLDMFSQKQWKVSRVGKWRTKTWPLAPLYLMRLTRRKDGVELPFFGTAHSMSKHPRPHPLLAGEAVGTNA